MSVWRTSGSVATIAASMIALTKYGHMRTLYAKKTQRQVGVDGGDRKSATAADGWTLRVGNRSESTFLRLLERLPDMSRYRIDAYGVYGCLPVNKHRMGKGRVVNRNEGLRSGTARQVKQAGEAHKGLPQDGWNANPAACAGVTEVGLDLTCTC